MNKKRKIANKLKATNDPLANTQLDNTLNKYTGYTEQELYSSLQSKFVLDDTDGIDVPNFILKRAKENDKEALFKIARVYYHGSKSDSKAFAWFHKAALQGHGSAQALVGWMYKSGTGIGKNYKLAMEWYLKGAAQDDFDAPSNIGYLYQYGLGVSIDYKEAMKWYMVSANKDHPYALNNVGNLYHRGLGVPRNIETAIKWYTRAALLEEGGEGAQCNLASIYETDPKYKNLQKAVNWYQKAAECDFDQAADKVKCLNHRGYFPKPEQKDQDIFDECINVNKNTTKNTSPPLFTTNNEDDKVNSIQDDFHLKVSLVEKESMPSKDALKALCFILEQQKLQNSKAYREKLVYDICFGPSDESDDDDDDSDYHTE